MGNRFLVLVSLLLGCVTVPPEYVPTNSTPWKTQMQADQTCLDLLAIGVDYGERPTVIDRRGFHRDMRPGIMQARGSNVICIFSWSDPKKAPGKHDNECTCDVTSTQLDANGQESLLPAHKIIRFNACHELHKLDRTGAIQTLEAKAR